MKAKRGFTIVELLIVIAVILTLAGITVVAATGAISSARGKRCEAMRVMLEQGLATYYAQEGKWPDAIEKTINGANESVIKFDDNATDKIFQDLVGKAWGKGGGKHSMLLDATGLYVCEASNCGNSNKGCFDSHRDSSDVAYCKGKGCRLGVDFGEAVKKNAKRHIPLSNMAFGYPGPREGKFCRFHISYNTRTDSVTVSQ